MKRLFLLLLMLSLGNTALAQKRIALVIGNSAYDKSIGALKNPVNDATDIAKTLSQLGFQVNRKLNATKKQMKQAISQFGKQLSERNTVGLFYFAGHGVQVNNRNYLIPIGSDIQGEADVEYEAVDAGRILGQMEAAGNDLNLVFLDACRDNPFGGSFRSSQRGLARIPVPRGSMIIYAASPGERASDGKGRNGIFTKHLLNQLNVSGISIDDVFNQTAEAVYQETGSAQLPYREGSIIGGKFYFKLATQAPSPVLNKSGAEDIWLEYMDRDDPKQIRLYLSEYPTGKLAPLFRLKLKNKTVLTYTLTVRSNVNGDTVYIDGKNYGATRLDVKLTPGEHVIKIEKKGYQTFEETIQLDKKQTVIGVLKKQAQPVDTATVSADTQFWQEINHRDIADLRFYLKEYPGGKYAVQARVKIKALQPKQETKGQTWIDPSTGMTFVWVPKGCFQMGSRSGYKDEKPVHEVCVDGYWLGQTEVTQGQWQKVMGKNPSHFKRCGSNCPVENVSWNDTQDFIRQLNARSNKAYRLPTEAEWEYACRSGGKNQTYAGSNSLNSVAWYGNNSDKKTHLVGQKNANGLGLYDMSGNVREWVQDNYSGSAYSTHLRDNPIYDAGGQNRVYRGGSWYGSVSFSRCAVRDLDTPGSSYDTLGFRLLRTP